MIAFSEVGELKFSIGKQTRYIVYLGNCDLRSKTISAVSDSFLMLPDEKIKLTIDALSLTGAKITITSFVEKSC